MLFCFVFLVAHVRVVVVWISFGLDVCWRGCAINVLCEKLYFFKKSSAFDLDVC